MRSVYPRQQRLHAWSACSAGRQCSQKLCRRLADDSRRSTNLIVTADRTKLRVLLTAPAKQAEFNLNSWGGLDYYDLNLFTYNTAVSIRPSNAACQPSGCARDLLEHCPGAGALADSGGDAIVCRSACALYLDVEHCLSPSAMSLQTKLSCPQGTVSYMADHAQLACPNSPDYVLTFCGLLP